MAVGGTRVVQITNIAPQATKDQMQTLFGYLGKIDDIRLYPTIRDVSCPVQSRICYVKFMDPVTVGIAQHMTNTVFIDRALIVIPVQNGEIPDEHKALEMTNNGTIVPGLYPTEPKLPPNVISSIEGMIPNQVVQTHDPQLEINSLPSYPPLPTTYDNRKIEEVRRTVLLSNFDGVSVSSEDIIDFFSEAGEVKYIRMCSRTSDNSTHALVEFSEQPSVLSALKLNGQELKGRSVSINHATQPIVKPQAKSNEAAQREIEEAMTRVKEAQSLISAAIDPVIGMLSKDKTRSSRRSRSRSRERRRRRSRSRSRSRRRSRSRHRSRRSRSRSKRSRSRDRKRRSRSGGRRRSRSRSRRRSRSYSRKSRSKSYSRSSRKEREKDRRSSKEKDKERKRDKESSIDEDKRSSKDKKRATRSRSRSRDRRRSKSRDRKRTRSRDRKRSRSRDRSRRRSTSPRTSKKRSRSRESKSSRDKDRKREKKEKKSKDRDKDNNSDIGAKVPRNYDEEEKGFDSEKETDKNGDSKHPEFHDDSSRDSSRNKPEQESEKSDNMDISNSP